MTFHSEYGQDRWLHENVFKGQRNGVFVEIGALDGILHSNSLFFEQELGWRGMLVEANPKAYASLLVNRPGAQKLHCAVFDKAGTVAFDAIDGPFYGWSGIGGAMDRRHKERIAEHIDPRRLSTVAVGALTLDTVLSLLWPPADRGIDYVSVDTEGSEVRILQAFPFAKWPIRVFGVENNWQEPDLGELMAANGYKPIGRVGVDDFFEKA